MKIEFRLLGVVLITRNEWTHSGVVLATQRINNKKCGSRVFPGLFTENNHDLSTYSGVFFPVIVTVGLIEGYILGWSCFLLYIDCFRESCSKSPGIVFPLKSILVRLFQNHKLRVEIKYMFSWCSERPVLSQSTCYSPFD